MADGQGDHSSLDRGQIWQRWTPAVADENPAIVRAVDAFRGPDTPAGRAATEWLREKSLPNARSSVTRLMLIDDEVVGFYSLCSSQVELRTSDREKLGGEHPVQPAALITWISKAGDTDIPGTALLSHAAGVALRASRDVGMVALVLDPYDAETAKFWRRRPYRFKSSLTTTHSGIKRLWRSLLL